MDPSFELDAISVKIGHAAGEGPQLADWFNTESGVEFEVRNADGSTAYVSVPLQPDAEQSDSTMSVWSVQQTR